MCFLTPGANSMSSWLGLCPECDSEITRLLTHRSTIANSGSAGSLQIFHPADCDHPCIAAEPSLFAVAVITGPLSLAQLAALLSQNNLWRVHFLTIVLDQHDSAIRRQMRTLPNAPNMRP